MSEFDRRAHPDRMRQWTWTGPDGWQHRRVDWPQPEGAAPRGSLLFAPGRADFIEKYLEAMAHWHGRGWNVGSFDWRGQGKSKGDIVAQHQDSFDPMLADVVALAADWRAATPPPHVIIGHSMGGHMLLRLLVERRPDIAAAVLTAPMIEVNPQSFGRPVARAVAAGSRLFGYRRRPLWKAPNEEAPPGSRRQKTLTGSLDRYADEAWWWRQDTDFPPSPPTFGWIDAAFRSARRFSAGQLRALGLPVLIVGAEKDRLVSASAIRRAARLIPRAELVMFADAAHELLREADPVRLAAHAEIDGFLDRMAPR